MKQAINTLSWEELKELTCEQSDPIEGPNNPQAKVRLFGKSEQEIRVTLYRDHHAWCPYCQKVWLWLEWKRIPYRIKKITMHCYGKKEPWYLKKVPSGMLPAIELDGRVITESDEILLTLEKTYGPLGESLIKPETIKLRDLERKLFRAWCIWLCNPSNSANQEKRRKEQFQVLAKEMNHLLEHSNTSWLDPIFVSSTKTAPGSGDVIFIPYLERMNASLTYYKGLSLRTEYPSIDKWFRSLEEDDVYLGTQGDFHTHSHDLPPQMGGCWIDPNPNQIKFSKVIDIGEGLDELETSTNPSIIDSKSIALRRVLKHRECIMRSNPIGAKMFDQPLRAALTNMIKDTICTPNQGSALGLRYLKDRVSVPRDMPLLSARVLRIALEKTASIDSSHQGPPIPIRNRFDQDPQPFLNAQKNS